jgi:hypothetical protein
VSKRVPGRTLHCMATLPCTPSIRRTSSVHGNGPLEPTVSASTTRTDPWSVVNTLSSTLVSGR